MRTAGRCDEYTLYGAVSHQLYGDKIARGVPYDFISDFAHNPVVRGGVSFPAHQNKSCLFRFSRLENAIPDLVRNANRRAGFDPLLVAVLDSLFSLVVFCDGQTACLRAGGG